MSKKERYCRDTKSKSSKSAKALERFLVDMDLSSPKFDDDYELRLAEMWALLNPPARVGFKRLNEGATIPTKAHPTDSGYDLYAAEDVIIETGDTAVVKTGIAVKLPPGYEAQVRPRSGVTSKSKIRVQIGTIDNGYTGEIGVIVDNILEYDFDIGDGLQRIRGQYGVIHIDGTRDKDYRPNYCEGTYLIRKGDRIAQLVIQSLPSVEAYEIDEDLVKTDRGSKGYGSTGVRE